MTTGPSDRYDNSNARCRRPLTTVTSQTPILNMASLQQQDHTNPVQTLEPIVSNPVVTQPAQARGEGYTRVDVCLQLICRIWSVGWARLLSQGAAKCVCRFYNKPHQNAAAMTDKPSQRAPRSKNRIKFRLRKNDLEIDREKMLYVAPGYICES